jgi:hypothetical protein
MRRRIARTPSIALVAWVACGGGLLGGCNAILGIHEPSDEVLVEDTPPRSPPMSSTPNQPMPAGSTAPVVPRPDKRRASWPMPNPQKAGLVPSLSSYRVDAAGVVTDEVTQLEWVQVVDDAPHMRDDAIALCDGLAIEGRSFRLPSRIELLSLVDFTTPAPTIDHEAFPSARRGHYWTVSTHSAERMLGWVINFGGGDHFQSSSSFDATNWVRCVAGPNALAAPLQIDEHTVMDPATGLEWQRESRSVVHAWNDATAYCKALDLNGSGWRLPTIKELATLVDETVARPAIDSAAFPGTIRAAYWTSSFVADSPGRAWTLNFDYGSDSPAALAAMMLARCVR